MVLLLETATVLETRARRSVEPRQMAVLLRRAEHRRREAAELRERLVERGAALGAVRGRSAVAGGRATGTVRAVADSQPAMSPSPAL